MKIDDSRVRTFTGTNISHWVVVQYQMGDVDNPQLPLVFFSNRYKSQKANYDDARASLQAELLKR